METSTLCVNLLLKHMYCVLPEDTCPTTKDKSAIYSCFVLTFAFQVIVLIY